MPKLIKSAYSFSGYEPYTADVNTGVDTNKIVPISTLSYLAKKEWQHRSTGGDWSNNIVFTNTQPVLKRLERVRGKVRYELKNFRGDIRQVISDVKYREEVNGVVEYTADVYQVADSYPFGWGMPGRTFSAGDSYRFGYQGSEINPELEGSYTTFYRQLDTRVGRWTAIDPVFQPDQSPYNSMNNNPILLTDPKGDFPIPLLVPAVISAIEAIAVVTTAAVIAEGVAQSQGHEGVLKGTWRGAKNAYRVYKFLEFDLTELVVTPGSVQSLPDNFTSTNPPMRGGYSGEYHWEGLSVTKSGNFGQGSGVLAPGAYQGDGSSTTAFPSAAGSADKEAITKMNPSDHLKELIEKLSGTKKYLEELKASDFEQEFLDQLDQVRSRDDYEELDQVLEKWDWWENGKEEVENQIKDLEGQIRNYKK